MLASELEVKYTKSSIHPRVKLHTRYVHGRARAHFQEPWVQQRWLFQTQTAPFHHPHPPNPPLLLRISHLSLSFFVVVSESRRGVKVQQQLPVSRCLRAPLLAIAPSLRTYMKKTLLLRSDGMDFGGEGGCFQTS